MNEQMIDIATIRLDGDTQPRVAIDQQAVTDYAAAMERGGVFPPVRIIFDGAENWLVDGFHRYHAHKKLERSQILAEVKTGVLTDAQWQSLTVNHTHGLRRTNDDKRKAVVKALKMHPELSDHALAEHVGVAHTTISRYRKSLEDARKLRESKALTIKKPVGTMCQLPNRTGKDGKKYSKRSVSKPGISPKAMTPVRGHSPVDDRRHIGMSKDPAMGARALFEFFDRSYIQTLVRELQALLDGTAGPAPTLRDIPQAQNA